MTTRVLGQQIEHLVCNYLEQQQAMQCLERNFQTTLGEIDLIMQHHDTRTFVEVRYRESGDAAITVDRQKQCRIIRVATQYLLQQDLYDKIPCRFDVVAVHGQPDQPIIDWLPDAFRH